MYLFAFKWIKKILPQKIIFLDENLFSHKISFETRLFLPKIFEAKKTNLWDKKFHPKNGFDVQVKFHNKNNEEKIFKG